AAQKNLVQAVRLGLEANTTPQVLDAALELADCCLKMGKHQDALILVLYVEQNSSGSALLQQRIQMLKVDLEKTISHIDWAAAEQMMKAQQFDKFLKERFA
ncbi:MAG TPA: hypothetical protein VN653_08610, partial [Anaerolineales bacterium]|nr:hypothetical protein [Anaerolineales bacterium]